MKFACLCMMGLAACAAPSQTLVFLEAPAGVYEEANELSLELFAEGEQVWAMDLEVERNIAALARIPIVPRGGDSLRTFELVARLSTPDGEVASTLRVGGGFESGALREIRARFDLSDRCRAVGDCGPGRTCFDGRCLGACYDLQPLDTETSMPACGECETCVRAECSPLADGSACGCGDRCAAGACRIEEETFDVSLGEHAVCAAFGNSRFRQLHCWGDNHACRAGIPCDVRAIDRPRPVQAPLMEGDEEGIDIAFPQRAALGLDHGCVLWNPENLGTRRSCWGWTVSGAVGIGEPDGGTEARTEVGGALARALDAGRFHTCGLDARNRVWCWGRNDFSSLGVVRDVPRTPGSTLEQDLCTNQREGAAPIAPTAIAMDDGSPLDGIGAIAAGWAATCVLESEGERRVFCWGWNDAGQLGNEASDCERPTAQCVTDAAGECITQVSAIGGGWRTFCALRPGEASADGGTLWCWGEEIWQEERNSGGQRHATRVGPPWAWRSVVPGQQELCAIRSSDDPEEDRALYCWGENSNGELGIGDVSRRSEPARVQVEKNDQWTEVALGTTFACGVREDRSLWCWGSNDANAPTLGEGCSAAGRLGLGLGSDAGCVPILSESEQAARVNVLRPRRVCAP